MKNLLAFVLAGACVQPAVACDLCSVYAATEAQGGSGKGFFAGVAEQYTYFNTLQIDGRDVPNEGNQYINSSVSQVFAGYNFNNRIGVQFNLPVIYRGEATNVTVARVANREAVYRVKISFAPAMRRTTARRRLITVCGNRRLPK